MSVVRRRKACAYVQELADARLPGEVADRAGQKGPGLAGDFCLSWKDSQYFVPDLAVDGVVVLAAQPVVPDPGRVRHGHVDSRLGGSRLGGAFGPG